MSLQVIVNMSHAAIVNPMANLGPPAYPGSSQQSSDQQYQLPQLTSAPQMPMLKPAPNVKSSGKDKPAASGKDVIKLNSDGKPIKKGELDPSTMVHVPGGW